MGRPIHTGLDYFPFDSNFFSDIKIRKLIKYQGGKAALVYIDLLCRIYGESGYYILWDVELPFIISDDLGSGYDEGYVLEVIKTCISVGLFDEASFQAGALTSIAIQTRYRKACEASRRKATISKFNLLEPLLIPEQNEVNAEETRPIVAETHGNDAEMQQRKEKEIKDIIPPISNEIVPPLENDAETPVVSVPAKPKTLEERRQEFYNSLIPYVEKYGREMVRDFYNYWSEVSDGGHKMAWEKAMTRKGTFNIAGRLAKWKQNQDNGYGSHSSKRGSTISEAVQAAVIPEGSLVGQLDITKLLGQ